MRVTVHVDGGARGNPGPAAAAAVITDAGGDVLDEASVRLGETTNNVAEYRGLALGLERARQLGARELDIVMDSELVVNQVHGRYRVAAPASRRCTAGRRTRWAASTPGRSAPSRERRTPAPTRS